VPRNAIFGELAVLSFNATLAFRAPFVLGENATLIVHDLPFATSVPQLFVVMNDDASGPLTAMPVILSVALPEFVNFTVFDVLLLSTVVLGKLKLATESLMAGPSKPTPARETFWGDLPALSANSSKALSVPFVLVANLTLTVQASAAASFVPQLLVPISKEVGSTPPMAIFVISSAAFPVLVSLISCAAGTSNRRWRSVARGYWRSLHKRSKLRLPLSTAASCPLAQRDSACLIPEL
jgi:hypothetical protein